MDLVVYTSHWCPDCRVAKRFLDKHKLEYKEIDIESVPGAAEEVVRRTGKRAIPQFVINGAWIQPYRPGEGFLYEEMSKLLGVEAMAEAASGGAIGPITPSTVRLKQ